MKKTLLSALAILAFTCSGLAQTLPSYVPANGLVGWWPFNGNANDESGNGYHGTVNGATLTADRFGNPGKAYEFDGSEWIATPLNSLSPEFSISIWFEVGSVSGPIRVILGKWEANGTGSSKSIEVAKRDTNNLGVVYSTNGTDINLVETNFNLANSVGWHNFSIVNSTQHLKFYLDNDLIYTSESQINIFNNSDPILIGATRNGTVESYNWIGSLDDIAIYNRALTQQEISALYQGGNTTANCPTFPASLAQGLVGYWPFCGNALDESGNNNHGTVNGATLTTDRFGNAGSAYGFNGVDSKITYPNKFIFNQANDGTISLWLKNDSIISNIYPLYG